MTGKGRMASNDGSTFSVQYKFDAKVRCPYEKNVVF